MCEESVRAAAKRCGHLHCVVELCPKVGDGAPRGPRARTRPPTSEARKSYKRLEFFGSLLGAGGRLLGTTDREIVALATSSPTARRRDEKAGQDRYGRQQVSGSVSPG